MHEFTQEALAQRLGKGQSTVANKLRLLKVTSRSSRSIIKREISERHATSINANKRQEAQINLHEDDD